MDTELAQETDAERQARQDALRRKAIARFATPEAASLRSVYRALVLGDRLGFIRSVDLREDPQ